VNAGTNSTSATNLHAPKSGNIHYIDINIQQPNVEECYNTSVDIAKTENSWMLIYPNPNPGAFMLELRMQQTGIPIEIGIFDLAGKRVVHYWVSLTDHHFTKEINVNFLEKGVYFIRVTGKEDSGVKQIIIN
jgi:hypothetical protein